MCRGSLAVFETGPTDDLSSYIRCKSSRVGQNTAENKWVLKMSGNKILAGNEKKKKIILLPNHHTALPCFPQWLTDCDRYLLMYSVCGVLRMKKTFHTIIDKSKMYRNKVCSKVYPSCKDQTRTDDSKPWLVYVIIHLLIVQQMHQNLIFQILFYC